MVEEIRATEKVAESPIKEVERIQPVEQPVIEEPTAKAPAPVMPENIQKLVDFMKETGGTIEDYTRLNRDYSQLDEALLRKEYYKNTKPHLDHDEISFIWKITLNMMKKWMKSEILKRKNS